MVYSGWKFILFLVFGRMTSNFICLTFSTLRSSSLWRIGTIFLSLDKTVYRPGTTSPSSRNLVLVGENSKLQPSRDKNLNITFIKKVWTPVVGENSRASMIQGKKQSCMMNFQLAFTPCLPAALKIKN